VQDGAGNALDGEFYGGFPSGNNVAGGNFVARVNYIHGIGSPPQPQFSSASPITPLGPPGAGFHVKNIRFDGRHFVRSTGATSPLNQDALYMVRGKRLVPVTSIKPRRRS
jgi:hypothetical protein